MYQTRWAVLISGRGSNLRALLQAARQASSRQSIAVVVASKASAAGIYHARRAGIPVEVLPPKVDWRGLTSLLKHYRVQQVFLAGFMKILPADFVQEWQGKILNLHPSLLPHFPGLNSMERAHEQNAPVGATVHEVVPAVDAGPIVLQREILHTSGGMKIDEVFWRVHVSEQRLVRRSFLRWKAGSA